MRAAVLGHGAFTLAMCGVMLAVQLVIYPQFRSVDPAGFSTYAADHATRIVTALALVAPLEIIFAAWIWLDPVDGIGRTSTFISGALLVVGWVATALWYAPLHGRFQTEGYDADRIEQLITTNWLRTAIWVARAGFALWFLWKIIDPENGSPAA